jgi:hypothetical protein
VGSAAAVHREDGSITSIINIQSQNYGGGIYVKYAKDSTGCPGCYLGAVVHGCR